MEPTENQSQHEFGQSLAKNSKKKNFNTIIIIIAIVIILILLFVLLSNNKQSNVNWIEIMTDPKNMVKIAKDV